jgi:hypothetical protein
MVWCVPKRPAAARTINKEKMHWIYFILTSERIMNWRQRRKLFIDDKLSVGYRPIESEWFSRQILRIVRLTMVNPM